MYKIRNNLQKLNTKQKNLKQKLYPKKACKTVV
jgi:hypothetical protein